MYAGLVYVLETVVGGGLADDEVVLGWVVVVVVITSCLANILTLPLPSKIKELFFTARKQSLGQGNVFTPVCDSIHRRGSVYEPLLTGIHTPWADTPRQTPPFGQTSPRAETHPRYYGIRSTSGRYASYSNAYLLQVCLDNDNFQGHYGDVWVQNF